MGLFSCDVSLAPCWGWAYFACPHTFPIGVFVQLVRLWDHDWNLIGVVDSRYIVGTSHAESLVIEFPMDHPLAKEMLPSFGPSKPVHVVVDWDGNRNQGLRVETQCIKSPDGTRIARVRFAMKLEAPVTVWPSPKAYF